MEEVQKQGRFKKSWLLTKGAWHALSLDKEMLTLPLIGFVFSIVLLAVFFGIGLLNPGGLVFHTTHINNGTEGKWGPLFYLLSISFILLANIVTTYISGAIAYGAIERFKGNDPSVKGSLKAAWRRLKWLSLFSVFSTTIGLVLSEIVSRLPFIGSAIVARLIDAGWRIASFFAIPIIVTSDQPIGPIKATKQSIDIIKKTWGESLIVSFGIGLVVLATFMVFGVLAAALLALGGVLALASWYFVALGILAILAIVAMILVFGVLQAFIRAAIYYYAVTGESPVQFDKQMLRQTFTPKKARKLFGRA